MSALFIHLQDRSVDLSTGEVNGPDVEETLTSREFALLRALVAEAPDPVSREALLPLFNAEPGSRVVDMTLANLRKKLGKTVVETVRGAGYRFAGPPPQVEARQTSAEAPSMDKDLVIDWHRRRVHVGDRSTGLTPLEVRVLRLLMGHPEGLSAAELARRAWGTFRAEGNVRGLIGRLRKKIEIDAKHPQKLLYASGNYQLSGLAGGDSMEAAVGLLVFPGWGPLSVADPDAAEGRREEAKHALSGSWTAVGSDMLALVNLDGETAWRILKETTLDEPVCRVLVVGEVRIPAGQAQPYGPAIELASTLGRAIPPGTWVSTVATLQALSRTDGVALGPLLVGGIETEPVVLAGRRAVAGLPITEEPSQDTQLVGRIQELADIESLLDRRQLVTVLGPGGVGKTTLVRALGGPGVVFVDLRPARTEEDLLKQLADALGAKGLSLPGARRTLASRGIHTMILDNCEQLERDAVQMVTSLMQSMPTVQIIATSRAPLGIEGEQQFRLGVPADDEAIALFVERARLVNPRFSAPREVLIKVVEQLDCLPLAIVLAAARIDVTPLERLTHGVSGLEALQASLQWSWDLLDDDMKSLFSAMGVFSGEAAQDLALEVAGVSAQVWEGLQRRSLVERVDANHSRGRMLVAIHAFAQQQAQSDPRWDHWVQVHGRAHSQVLADAGPALRHRGLGAWFRWRCDQQNLILAFKRTHDPVVGLAMVLVTSAVDERGHHLLPVLEEIIPSLQGAQRQLARLALGWTQNLVGQASLGRELVLQAMEHPDSDDGTRAFAYRGLMMLDVILGIKDEVRRPQVTDLNDVAWCEVSEAWRLELKGNPKEAWPPLERAKSIFRRIGNQDGLLVSLSLEAGLEYQRGNWDTAAALSEEAADLAQQYGLVGLWVQRQRTLALIRKQQGDLQASAIHNQNALEGAASLGVERTPRLVSERAGILLAMGRTQESLRVAQQAAAQLGDSLGLHPEVMFRLGAALHANERHAEAEEAWDSALRAAIELGDETGAGWVYEGRAQRAWQQGQREQARTLQTSAVKAFEGSYREAGAREKLLSWQD